MTAQHIAEASRDAMWANDRACQALGIQVTAVGPGTATLTMPVREDMLNGHDLCHGGLIATLADPDDNYFQLMSPMGPPQEG